MKGKAFLKDYWQVFVFILAILCVVSFLIFMVSVTYADTSRQIGFLRQICKERNIEIKEGIVESPSFIIVLNRTEFIGKLMEFSVDGNLTIYDHTTFYVFGYTEHKFYVFEQNYAIAYMWSP